MIPLPLRARALFYFAAGLTELARILARRPVMAHRDYKTTPATVPAPSVVTDETGHVDVKCTDPQCNGCMFCAGGLWACTVCGGAEGAMPSTCPGEDMDADTVDAVYAGRKDFRDGQWVEEISPYSPAAYAKYRAEDGEIR